MNIRVILTMKEQHKLNLVNDYEAGKVRAQRAAEVLGITKRQFRRLVAAYRGQGIAAMAHGAPAVGLVAAGLAAGRCVERVE